MRNKINVAEDLSALTGISTSALTDFYKLTNMCIAHAVKEASLDKNEEDAYIDIGIGTLTIHIDSDEIKYRFAPSRPLKNSIEESLQGDEDVLAGAINLKIKERFEKAYKELL